MRIFRTQDRRHGAEGDISPVDHKWRLTWADALFAAAVAANVLALACLDRVLAPTGGMTAEPALARSVSR